MNDFLEQSLKCPILPKLPCRRAAFISYCDQSSQYPPVLELHDVMIKLQKENPKKRMVQIMEWCEKQMEFVLTRGRRELTEAMKAGSLRHQQLEEEKICFRKYISNSIIPFYQTPLI
ncbi:hypothetical protein EJ110_NYTH19775 [Nymphaea thermarum]|nr:hypothetical protein EJ110_NYTH19775 [Nymphaea thermarum]